MKNWSGDQPGADRAGEAGGGGAQFSGLIRVAPRLRAVILLGGSLRESELAKGSGRSPLDLPLAEGESVLAAWSRHIGVLANAMGLKNLPVRLLLDQASKEPVSLASDSAAGVTIERDRAELRGTGGLLRDLAAEYGSDDMILVANAHQAVIEPLPDLVNELACAGSDGSLLATDEGAPCGLMLLRCGAMMSIKRIGFVDFKEQALPGLARTFDLRAVVRPAGAVRPVRTLDSYLTALRSVHAPDVADAEDPFAEDWFKTFGIVESGAEVSPSAQVHDSVVLRGARVGAGAVLVRCVVGENARVEGGAVIGDRLVATGEEAGA